MISMILRKNKFQNKIAYHKTGKGEPIILLHGLGLRAESWIEQINFFKKKFTVYALDFPGHGKSDILSGKKVDLKNYSEKVVQFIKDKNINKPILIGHSFGALITIQIAGLHPSILKSGIAVAPIHDRSKEALMNVKKRAKELKKNPSERITVIDPIQRWFNNSRSKKIIDTSNFIEDLLKLNKKFNLKGYTMTYDIFSKFKGSSSKIIKNISVPMLYITGEKDFNSTPLMSKNLAKLTKGEFVVVKNARHILQLTHSTKFNFYLNQFIKSLNSSR